MCSPWVTEGAKRFKKGDGGKLSKQAHTKQLGQSRCKHEHNNNQHSAAVLSKQTADRDPNAEPTVAAAPGGQASLGETLRASPTQSDGTWKRMRIALRLSWEGIAIDK